ncbi:MAG TPA: histidine phosphatase family protein [Acidimicrobiales bacterium]
MERASDDSATLWLVRHGESTWNALGLIQGHAPEPTLTAKGRDQVERLAEQFEDGAISLIYSSDLERAEATAAIIGRALGVPCHQDAALRERSFGTFEGYPLSSLDPAWTGIAGDRVVDADARPPRGESLADVYERVSTFVEGCLVPSPAGDVLVVSHGGAIRALRAYCSGVAVENMAWDVVSNASVWRVDLLDQRQRVAP